jgi:hypothetical protein
MSRNTAWEFRTKQFRVALEIEPEDTDPADSFESQEDIDAVRNGDVEWFCAVVSVYHVASDGTERRLGWDSLGGCAYNSVREFYTSHRDPDPLNRNCTAMRAARGNVCICHYFPDMVKQATLSARRQVAARRSIPCRYY